MKKGNGTGCQMGGYGSASRGSRWSGVGVAPPRAVRETSRTGWASWLRRNSWAAITAARSSNAHPSNSHSNPPETGSGPDQSSASAAAGVPPAPAGAPVEASSANAVITDE